MYPTDHYLAHGYQYLLDRLDLTGADEGMISRVRLSRQAVMQNLDRTAGGELLRGAYKHLAKRLHPDRHKNDADRKAGEREFANLKNVYDGMKSLITGTIPERDYFTTLDIPVPPLPKVRRQQADEWHRPAQPAPNRGNVQTGDGHAWKQAAEESLRRYRRARTLGYAAAGLSAVAAVTVGSLPFTTFYELAASTVTQREMNWTLLKAVEHAYPTAATIGTVAAYTAAGVDVLRGTYSVVRQTTQQMFRDLFKPRPY